MYVLCYFFSYSYDLSNSLQYNLTPAQVPEEELKGKTLVLKGVDTGDHSVHFTFSKIGSGITGAI